jgi:hypothetical protein
MSRTRRSLCTRASHGRRDSAGVDAVNDGSCALPYEQQCLLAALPDGAARILGWLPPMTGSQGNRKPSSRSNEQMLRLGQRTIRLTNPDKVLYPCAGFTKRQVVEYYIAVAPFLLPHLRDRPVTLKR